MRRRMLLRTAALGGAGLLAGCTGEPSPRTDDEAGSPTDSPTRSPMESSSETTTDSRTPGESGFDRSFDVTNVDCGSSEDSADVTADGDAVVVTGVAGASDPCYSARLVDERTTVSDGTLSVAVETYVPPENEDKACAQCIANVDYEATFTFHAGLPDHVEVSHDGELVAEVDL